MPLEGRLVMRLNKAKDKKAEAAPQTDWRND
jgi:hypothetical protein